MELTDDEKEYLLSVLEANIADHEGLKEWKEYRICKALMMKLDNE